MLGASHSFFLLHLFQVIVVLDVLTGSQRQDGDSKAGDWVAGVAERAEEPACSVANVRARTSQGVAEMLTVADKGGCGSEKFSTKGFYGYKKCG